jgi:hypothetical protein
MEESKIIFIAPGERRKRKRAFRDDHLLSLYTPSF